jgi:hypothetical protein
MLVHENAPPRIDLFVDVDLHRADIGATAIERRREWQIVRHFAGIFAGELALSIGLPEGAGRFEVVASGPILRGSLVLRGGLHPCGHGMVLSPSHVRGSRFRDTEAVLEIAISSHEFRHDERRNDVSHFAVFFRGCACNPQGSGIERQPLGDPLSLAGRGPCCFSSSVMPTLPRQYPSDGNSAETHGGSQKFQSSTCGVKLLAGGGLSFSGVGSEPSLTNEFHAALVMIHDMAGTRNTAAWREVLAVTDRVFGDKIRSEVIDHSLVGKPRLSI